MTAVVVVPYDPRWPELFARAREELQAALGDAAVAIEHVGSTAVTGLAAKPIVDVAVAVTGFGHFSIEAVERLGYRYVPEHEAQLPDRRFFSRPGYHVHLYEAGHREFDDHLRFRDRLRASPHDASAYEQLKLDLAERHADAREAYTDAKAPFIRDVLAKVC